MGAVEQQFRAAMEAVGIRLNDELVADGRIHLFHVDGDKRGSKNGRYCLNSDPHPGGWFGTWRDGGRWHTWSPERQAPITSAERAVIEARRVAARAARDAEAKAIHDAARERAEHLWNASSPAYSGHPYLARKGVCAFGIRALKGSLVIPLRDHHGRIWSLQFIGQDGGKRFLSGGRKKGLYFPIGNPQDVLCVAEGYATAASIHAATGYAVAVAFDCGNIESAARVLRQKFPAVEIIICADNDARTAGNPGLTCAIKAARDVNGLVAYPKFEGGASGD